MTVRRLRKKQRGPWCSYCERTGLKVRAVHRGTGFRVFACSEHLGKLEQEDGDERAREAYQTEAEFQLGL